MSLIRLALFALSISLHPKVTKNCYEGEFKYRLKLVAGIYDPLVYEGVQYRMQTSTLVDISSYMPEDRFKICEKALTIRRLQGRYFMIQDESYPDEEKMYILTPSHNTDIGHGGPTSELVGAIKCPTYPAVYLQFYNDKDMFGKVIWVIIKECELPPKVVHHDEPASTSTV